MKRYLNTRQLFYEDDLHKLPQVLSVRDTYIYIYSFWRANVTLRKRLHKSVLHVNNTWFIDRLTSITGFSPHVYLHLLTQYLQPSSKVALPLSSRNDSG